MRRHTRRQAKRLGCKRSAEQTEDAAEDGCAKDLWRMALHRIALCVDAEAKADDNNTQQSHERITSAQRARAL